MIVIDAFESLLTLSSASPYCQLLILYPTAAAARDRTWPAPGSP
jgi:hypothetical protein